MPAANVGAFSTPPSGNGRSRTWLLLLFIFLIAWQIVLVWIFPHFASQDGASHLYNAALIRGFRDPAWRRVPEFYRLNSRLVPNWFTYAVLAGLDRFFSPATAEKIIVSGYFVLFPLSFAYVVRTFTKEVWLFAIWGLVLANNLFIAMGFYNFCYSLVFFLLCFGYWMRERDGLGPKRLAGLCVLASLLYFSHVVGFFMAAFFIGVVALCFGLAERRSLAENGDSEPGHATSASTLSSPNLSTVLKRLLVPQLAFLPCVVIFCVSSIGSQPPFDPGKQSFSQRLLVFRELHVLVDSRGAQGILRMSLVGVFLAWGFYRAIANAVEQRRLAASDGLGILAVVCLSLCVVVPWSISGGGMIPERMAWFALCAALLWLSSSSTRWSIQARRAAIGGATLVVVLGLIGQTGWRYQLSPVVNAYEEAGRLLAPQKTILSLCYCNPEDNSNPVFSRLRIRPLEHAGDIAALEGRALSLDNYEAMGSAFPVEYRPLVNPALHSGTFSASSVSSKPQNADIAGYEAQTGKTVDYVLLWGTGPGDLAESGSILNRQLRSNYEQIHTSPPPAMLRLFKRRQTPITQSGSTLGAVFRRQEGDCGQEEYDERAREISNVEPCGAELEASFDLASMADVLSCSRADECAGPCPKCGGPGRIRIDCPGASL